jgi:hypothetical protein
VPAVIFLWKTNSKVVASTRGDCKTAQIRSGETSRAEQITIVSDDFPWLKYANQTPILGRRNGFSSLAKSCDSQHSDKVTKECSILTTL